MYTYLHIHNFLETQEINKTDKCVNKRDTLISESHLPNNLSELSWLVQAKNVSKVKKSTLADPKIGVYKRISFDRCYVLCSQKRSACITFKLQTKIVSKVQKSTKEIHVYTTISESAIWQKDASAFTCLQSSRRLAHNGTWLCIPAKWQMTVSFSRQVTDTLWYTNKLFYWTRAEKSLIFVEERHISTLQSFASFFTLKTCHTPMSSVCVLFRRVISRTWWAWTRGRERGAGVQRAQWWRVPRSTATVRRESHNSVPGNIVGEQKVE